ncbi:MAG: DUF3667 domain-containing protein [Candidatus Eisenbacteria bacterium]
MSEDRPHTDVCLNCGASGAAKYCPECGQESVSTLVSFRTLLGQFFDDFFSLDSTFLRSFGLLVAKPGQLSLEYSRGRRKRYASPVRIYLLSSVTFFLVVSLLIGWKTRPSDAGEAGESAPTETVEGGTREAARADAVADETGETGPSNTVAAEAGETGHQRTFAGRSLSIGGNGSGSHNQEAANWTRWIPLPDSVAIALDDEIEALQPERFLVGNQNVVAIAHGDSVAIPTWMALRLPLTALPDSVREQLAEIDPADVDTGLGSGDGTMNVSIFGRNRRVDQKEFFSEVYALTPKMLFVLFPAFALVLQLIYLRRKRYYVEHLVFSLHCHAFLFLVLLLAALTQHPKVILATFPIVAGYVYLAMKRFYGQGWFKTALKFLILSSGYFVLFIVLGILTLIASVWVLTALRA